MYSYATWYQEFDQRTEDYTNKQNVAIKIMPVSCSAKFLQAEFNENDKKI